MLFSKNSISDSLKRSRVSAISLTSQYANFSASLLTASGPNARREAALQAPRRETSTACWQRQGPLVGKMLDAMHDARVCFRNC